MYAVHGCTTAFSDICAPVPFLRNTQKVPHIGFYYYVLFVSVHITWVITPFFVLSTLLKFKQIQSEIFQKNDHDIYFIH